MVTWLILMLGVCNYLGIRRILANLPGYKRQAAFNDLTMRDWSPRGVKAGVYKCLLGEEGSGEGNLCYVEVDGAGHELSREKPMEGSVMMAKWMNEMVL